MPIVALKGYAKMQAEYYAELQRLAELAFRMYGQNIYQRLYLVGKQ